MNLTTLTLIVTCFAIVSTIPVPRKRARRPTKAREQTIVPPISCPDLYEASIGIGDEGPLIRKTQHNSDCKKYFECVTNRWLARDCPDGTTFNGEAKGCDSLKTCKPSKVEELFDEGVVELKDFLGIGDDDCR